VNSIISELDNVPLGFVENQYSEALADTYVRTISDIQLISKGRKLRILEIGAFTGVVSVALKRLGHEVTAHDIPLVMSNQALQIYYSRNGVSTTTFDLKDYPYSLANNSYDFIILCEVLEHLPFNPIPVLREFGRILASKGLCYIATPNLTSLVHRYFMVVGKSFSNPVKHFFWALNPSSSMSVGIHWKEYTKSELIEFCESTGLNLKKHYYCKYVNDSGSSLIRKALVNFAYRAMPQLMQCQVGIFEKR